jgi:hypothetical protein
MEEDRITLLDDALRKLLDNYMELTGIESHGIEHIQPVGFPLQRPDRKIIEAVASCLYRMIRGPVEKYLKEKKYHQLGLSVGFIQGAIWALGLRSMYELQQKNAALRELLIKMDEKND